MDSPGVSYDRSQRGPEDIWALLRDHRPDVVASALRGSAFTEEMAIFVAKKRQSTPEILGILASDRRFSDSYRLKVAICKNPRTPQRIVFSLLKHLRVFDLGDLTLDRQIPVAVRQKIEASLSERLASLPSGVKIALSMRVSPAIVARLMERGDEKVIRSCLQSPLLTEGLLCELLNRRTVSPLVVRIVAGHPKWSVRSGIRFCLIRNFHTPMTHVLRFIEDRTTKDLKELYHDPGVPSGTRPFLFRALQDRGQCADRDMEEWYEITDEEPPPERV